jgi:ketosteroid isomerase-like protein
LAAYSAKAMQPANDILAINVANTELREGYNAGDVERILAVFASGFTDFTADEPSFYGSEARAVLKQRVTHLFRDYDVHLAITIIDVVVRGDTAIDYGWRERTLIPKAGGEPATTRTRYVNVWERSAEGKWQIGIFINNADLPPTMAELEEDEQVSAAAKLCR